MGTTPSSDSAARVRRMRLIVATAAAGLLALFSALAAALGGETPSTGSAATPATTAAPATAAPAQEETLPETFDPGTVTPATPGATPDASGGAS